LRICITHSPCGRAVILIAPANGLHDDKLAKGNQQLAGENWANNPRAI